MIIKIIICRVFLFCLRWYAVHYHFFSSFDSFYASFQLASILAAFIEASNFLLITEFTLLYFVSLLLFSIKVWFVCLPRIQTRWSKTGHKCHKQNQWWWWWLVKINFLFLSSHTRTHTLNASLFYCSWLNWLESQIDWDMHWWAWRTVLLFSLARDITDNRPSHCCLRYYQCVCVCVCANQKAVAFLGCWQDLALSWMYCPNWTNSS